MHLLPSTVIILIGKQATPSRRNWTRLLFFALDGIFLTGILTLATVSAFGGINDIFVLAF